MIKAFYFILMVLACGLSLNPTALAQDDGQVEFVPATHDNLSRLFWKFGEYSTQDTQKVSDFLKTAECGLYAHSYNDDFAWQNILTGAKRHIDYYKADFPVSFEIVSIVFLDRYDFNRRSFQIMNRFALENEGAIIFPFEDHKQMGCPLPYNSASFPYVMKFAPENRFLLTHLPVPPQEADALTERLSQYNYPKVGNFEGRALMSRIRLRIEDLTYINANQGVIYNGRLEEIAFFEDPAMTKPVWIKSLKDRIN